jgi:hemerythrin-like metal-binding protein
MMKGQAALQLAQTLYRLADYTEKHFRNEEALMRDAGYPELAEHSRVHRAMTEKVRRLREQVAAGDARITAEVLNFLTAWLSEHILKTDMKYAAHLQTAAAR